MNPESEYQNPAPRRRKSQKKNPGAILTIPVVALGVVLMLVSCGNGSGNSAAGSDEAQQIAVLQSENLDLQAQVQELTEKNIKLSNRIIELMTQQKLTAEDIALIQTQLDIIEGYADELPEEAAKALNNIIEYLNSK